MSCDVDLPRVISAYTHDHEVVVDMYHTKQCLGACFASLTVFAALLAADHRLAVRTAARSLVMIQPTAVTKLTTENQRPGQ
eukprot:COSAG05_NODE_2901_length_2526_cov_2.026370_3_plen_81_part_00